jgi:hypothetical protein
MVQVSFPVRVIEVSLGGVLLWSDHQVDVGSRGRLQLQISGLPISTDIEILRVERTGEIGHHIGALFSNISSGDRSVLERFTHT